MKKNLIAIACVSLSIGLTACSDSATSTNDTLDSADNNTAGNTATGTDNTAVSAPFTAEDSTFVMKAATGGMMEVEAGNAAQQNGMHDRVKAYGTMMVNDHNKANSELMALASGKNVTIPSTLPPDLQNHVEGLKKMKGAAFDKHYMEMMVNDHAKTIADFEKQANSGGNAELRTWAAKTLPTLRMHADSARAIHGDLR